MAMNSDVIGLGLESSCDETSAALVKNGTTILSNVISSQIDLHREYCGVVPEIASRAHLERINGIVREALDEAKLSFNDLAYVSATVKPGLVGSLLIALQSAKSISFVCGIPLIGVNHLEAHLYAPFLTGNVQSFPYLGLLVSGGNTALFHVHGVGNHELLGRTVDDAVGEAFDKVAKFLDLGYPGGPVIERLAEKAKQKKLLFPKIMTEKKDYRFSYSGLKTAVIQFVMKNPSYDKAELVYGFQEAALELLVRRVFDAARELNLKKIVVAGGVAANGRLRAMLAEKKLNDEEIIIPPPILCTDNAAMVAGLGYRYFTMKKTDTLNIDVSARY